MSVPLAHAAIWTIAALAVLGVLVRPFRWPEAVWAAAGAAALLALGLIGPADALAGAAKSLDVCLFLAGMMLLSEAARRSGLFDWLAGHAVGWSHNSPRRLFMIVYLVGIGVTAVMSNDATAVVLTPAVYAAARRARVDPTPLLFICAFIANAASFLLPIANPANLVLFASHPPPITAWVARFALPSLLAIAATFVALRLSFAGALRGEFEVQSEAPRLSRVGAAALAGVVASALALVAASAARWMLGPPTCVMGVLTAGAVCVWGRHRPWTILRGVSWSVLPLVAGLFVIVEGLMRTGLIGSLARELGEVAAHSQNVAAVAAGFAVALLSNLTNNLPSGLVASATAAAAHPHSKVLDCLLIGVDLGPNLSITGSLATVLWLAAIRREGEQIGFWRFLMVGAIVMPPALALALVARLLIG